MDGPLTLAGGSHDRLGESFRACRGFHARQAQAPSCQCWQEAVYLPTPLRASLGCTGQSRGRHDRPSVLFVSLQHHLVLLASAVAFASASICLCYCVCLRLCLRLCLSSCICSATCSSISLPANFRRAKNQGIDFITSIRLTQAARRLPSAPPLASLPPPVPVVFQGMPTPPLKRRRSPQRRSPAIQRQWAYRLWVM